MGNKQHYKDKRLHLSQYQIIRYNEGKMGDAEMHQVEMHSLSCSFCSDALDGIDFIEDGQAATTVALLKERLSYRIGRTRKNEKLPIWKWAAVAAILLFSSLAIILILDTSNGSQNNIVKTEPVKTESLAPLKNKPAQKLKTDTDRAGELIVLNETPIDKNPPLPTEVSEKAEMAESTPQVVNNSPESNNSADEALIANSEREEASETLVELENIAIENGNLEDAPTEAKRLTGALSGRAAGISVEKPNIIVNQRLLSGSVFDDSGEPIPGAIVILKGSTVGTISDINGAYILPIPNSDTTIEISFIGYLSESIFVDDTSTMLSTTLRSDMATLSEVVVTGYGTQSKQDVTGAVAVEKNSAGATPENGRRKFDKYIQQNLITEEAEKIGVKGAIEVSFFVAENGALSNLKIVDSIGYGLDEKVIQLIEDGPKWELDALQNKDALRQPVVLKIPVNIRKK